MARVNKRNIVKIVKYNEFTKFFKSAHVLSPFKKSHAYSVAR